MPQTPSSFSPLECAHSVTEPAPTWPLTSLSQSAPIPRFHRYTLVSHLLPMPPSPQSDAGPSHFSTKGVLTLSDPYRTVHLVLLSLAFALSNGDSGRRFIVMCPLPCAEEGFLLVSSATCNPILFLPSHQQSRLYSSPSLLNNNSPPPLITAASSLGGWCCCCSLLRLSSCTSLLVPLISTRLLFTARRRLAFG